MGAKLDFYKTAMRNRAKKGFLVEEAVCYAEIYAKCWRSTPGAIQWLESQEG